MTVDSWVVHSNDALRVWVRDGAPPSLLTPVAEWIDSWILGPPEDYKARPGDPTMRMSKLEGTRVTVEYLVVDYERFILVKRIEH